RGPGSSLGGQTYSSLPSCCRQSLPAVGARREGGSLPRLSLIGPSLPGAASSFERGSNTHLTTTFRRALLNEKPGALGVRAFRTRFEFLPTGAGLPHVRRVVREAERHVVIFHSADNGAGPNMIGCAPQQALR